MSRVWEPISYESYAGSILATAALGVAAVAAKEHDNIALQLKYLSAPMILAGIGVILSVLGIYMVRTKEGASMKQLMGSLNLGINGSAVGIAVLAIPVLMYLDLPNKWQIWGAIVAGLSAGLIIGKVTEVYTSHDYSPTQAIARQAETGPATVIIEGIAVGMQSTAIPVITIIAAVAVSFYLPGGAEDTLMGLYGVGIAAVGMLATLGITLATDAYGPIADNAGGNAEMAELGAGRPSADGSVGFARKHDRRNRQRVCHRFRRTDRACTPRRLLGRGSVRLGAPRGTNTTRHTRCGDR